MIIMIKLSLTLKRVHVLTTEMMIQMMVTLSIRVVDMAVLSSKRSRHKDTNSNFELKKKTPRLPLISLNTAIFECMISRSN